MSQRNPDRSARVSYLGKALREPVNRIAAVITVVLVGLVAAAARIPIGEGFDFELRDVPRYGLTRQLTLVGFSLSCAESCRTLAPERDGSMFHPDQPPQAAGSASGSRLHLTGSGTQEDTPGARAARPRPPTSPDSTVATSTRAIPRAPCADRSPCSD